MKHVLQFKEYAKHAEKIVNKNHYCLKLTPNNLNTLSHGIALWLKRVPFLILLAYMDNVMLNDLSLQIHNAKRKFSSPIPKERSSSMMGKK